jgi:hypothetical protein
MARFDEGVKFYDTGRVTISVNFPEGDRKCRWCPMCKSDNGIRHRCILTDRILYTTETIPDECPLKFEEDAHEGNAAVDC